MILAEDAETVSSADVQPDEAVLVDDGLGQWLQRQGIGDAPVRAVLVLEHLVRAQRVRHPAFRDRVHEWHPDPAGVIMRSCA